MIGTGAVGSMGSPATGETSPAGESATATARDPEGATATAQAAQAAATEGRGQGAGARDRGGQIRQHHLVARLESVGDLREGRPDGPNRDRVFDLFPLADLVDEAGGPEG